MGKKILKFFVRKVMKNKTSYSISLPKEAVEKLSLENAYVRIYVLENTIVIEKE